MSEPAIESDSPDDRTRSVTRVGNLIMALILATVALVFIITAATTLRMVGQFGPGPGFIPLCAAIGTFLGSLYLAFRSYQGAFDTSGDAVLYRIKPTLGYIGILVGGLLLVPVVGLILALFLIMFLIFLFIEGAGLLRSLAVSAGVAFGAYLLLVKVLGAPTPPSLFTLF